MNQSEFLAINCNSLEAREKSRVRGTIGFGFTSHWLKNWRESFKPITKRINRTHIITFDSHLKTAISRVHGAIGLGFASHWLKNCRESFKPITKRSNRNHVITFDSHLKTAL